MTLQRITKALHFIATLPIVFLTSTVTPIALVICAVVVIGIQQYAPITCMVPAEYSGGSQEKFLRTACGLSKKFTEATNGNFEKLTSSFAKNLMYTFGIQSLILAIPNLIWQWLQKVKERDIEAGDDFSEYLFEKIRKVVKDETKTRSTQEDVIRRIIYSQADQLSIKPVLYFLLCNIGSSLVLCVQVWWIYSFLREEGVLRIFYILFDDSNITQSRHYPTHIFCNVTYLEMANTTTRLIECINKANLLLHLLITLVWFSLAAMTAAALIFTISIGLLYFVFHSTFFDQYGIKSEKLGAGGVHLWILMGQVGWMRTKEVFAVIDDRLTLEHGKLD